MSRPKLTAAGALGAFAMVVVLASPAAATLSDNFRIDSEALGYALQYRVYTPDSDTRDSDAKELPVLYMTDGQWYIDYGDLPSLLDRMIAKGQIAPLIAVFVDNRDPDNLRDNRRNRQFFCNENYARFFSEELIPTIDEAYETNSQRGARVILGLSFGGLNSACFGLLAHQTFEGIAMQSPAMHPVPKIYDAYAEAPKHDLRIFLSTGTAGDNPDQALRLKKVLVEKGYELRYKTVLEGHNWQNWRPLLDDVLEFFFSATGSG